MFVTPAMSIYESTFAKSDKTDAILVVEGKKLHVNKAVLSFHSEYFKTLFNGEFKEKSMQEIPIKDVKFEDFAATLSLLYPCPIKPTEENAEKLLELAERFLIPSAKYSLELFMKMCKMEKMNKIRIADKCKFMDSPIDLSAFVLYNLRLWESAETSYKKYEKLCKAMGKEAISYEEYKYWFQMFYKQKERDDLPIPDIRCCILSDVINGKTAQKSMNDLCDVFKNHKIDKEDHGYWYKRFKNGHLFSQVTFSNLPEDVISEIAGTCDLTSYFQLRNVSHSLRSIVDHTKPPITHIIVECEENQISLNLNNEVPVIFTDLNDVDPPSDFPDHFYKFKDNDYQKVAFNYLEILLKNPKLQLDYVQLVFSDDTHNKNNQMFRDLLNSLSHKIHVKEFHIHFLTDKDIITVVKCVKPGTLKSLLVFENEDDEELSTIHELVETEQWRNAEIFLSGKLLDTSIEHFFHFDRFLINIKSLSMEDVMNLTSVLSNSANFEYCRVTVVRYDQEAVKNALRLQYNHSSAPRLKSELYPNLVFRLSTSSIEIFKANFRMY